MSEFSFVQRMDLEIEKKHTLEKQFHVRNIPVDYDEWKVFHCFHKFGLVDDIRLPAPQNVQQTRFRFGFVSMLTYEGADAVRNALQDGQLAVAEGVNFKVENVNVNNMKKVVNADKENNARGRFNNKNGNNGRTPFGNSRANVNKYPQNDDKKPTFEQSITAGRLPTKPINVKVVDLPINAPSTPFRFFVVPKERVVDNRFEIMRARMIEVVKQAPVDPSIAKNLMCAIIMYDSRPTRASIFTNEKTGELMAYLVDDGRQISFLPHAAWAMPSDVAIVPARVCECAFAGIYPLKKDDDPKMTMVRDLLEKVWSHPSASLRLNCIYMKDRMNMVTATSVFVNEKDGRVEEGNIAEGLASKGMFRYDPSDTIPRYYSRPEMMSLRITAAKLPVPEVILKDFQSLYCPDLAEQVAAISV